ncbi:hypothetical protein GN956_G23878 [Arapaima gigas]
MDKHKLSFKETCSGKYSQVAPPQFRRTVLLLVTAAMGRNSVKQSPFSVRKAVLKTTDGKIASIRPKKYIEVQDIQEENAKKKYVTVFMYTGEGKSVYMAFRFQLKRKFYFPVVKNNELKVLNHRSSPSDEFFFKWGEESGNAKSLVSVAAPQVYLSCEGKVVTVGTAHTSTPPLLFDMVWLE